MLGTIVNAVGILIGSGLGLIFKKYLKKIDEKLLLQVIGVFVALIGLTGVLKNMLYIDKDVLKSQYELVVLVTLVLGTILELRLDNKVNNFSEKSPPSGEEALFRKV